VKVMKEFLKSRSLKLSLTFCLVASMLVCTAFAEGETGGTTATITAAFQTGFQQMVTDALGLIAVMVPIALSLAGVIFLTKKVMSWWKGMAK